MSTSIKALKSGEFKCCVCGTKFKTKDTALKHLKSPEHIQAKKQAKQQEQAEKSMAESTAMITTMKEEQQQHREQQDQMLSVINGQLELIINKVDLLAERVNHVELRLTHFENQFEEHLIQPRLQELKVKETIQKDQMLKSHLDEVKQIELAEQLIQSKVNELKMQKQKMSQPFSYSNQPAAFTQQPAAQQYQLQQQYYQQPQYQQPSVQPIPQALYTSQPSQNYCSMCGSQLQ